MVFNSIISENIELEYILGIGRTLTNSIISKIIGLTSRFKTAIDIIIGWICIVRHTFHFLHFLYVRDLPLQYKTKFTIFMP